MGGVMEGGKGNRLTWEEEGGQAESESPPASSGARKPHPSHRGAEVRRKGCQEGAPRAPETSLEDEGGSLAVGGRSEDPGQPQPSVGAGWAGWDPRGCNPGPGCRRLRASADARSKLLESCPLRLLRSPPRPGPRPLLPRKAGLGRGTHPRRARLPG